MEKATLRLRAVHCRWERISFPTFRIMMPTMKKPALHLLATTAILAASSHISQGATAFWAFQTEADGSTGTNSLTANLNDGFASVSAVSTFLGGNGATNASSGGQTSYDFNSTTYTGNGTSVSGGATRCIGWQASSAATLTGAGFGFGLNTMGLTDLSLSFSVRSATSSASTVGPAPTQFALIEYSIDGGDNWVDTGLADSFTWSASTSFNARSPVLSFSGITAIENQPDVMLRFVLGNTKLDGASGTIALRIDNLELNAIPEPTSLSASAAAGLLLLVRRRRR